MNGLPGRLIGRDASTHYLNERRARIDTQNALAAAVRFIVAHNVAPVARLTVRNPRRSA